MMECKKALTVSNDDFSEAVAWLRKNGSMKAASKLAGRDASEGLVGIYISTLPESKHVGSIVRVSSETDFASRSPEFSSLVQSVAETAVSMGSSNDSVIDADMDKLMNTASPSNDQKQTVKEILDDAILAIRENLQIANAKIITGTPNSSTLAGYVHGCISNTTQAGTAAALVELIPINGRDGQSDDDIQDIGKKLAMHIVAAKPSYLCPKCVPEEVIEKERTILMEQMEGSGKPAEILDKIITGRLRKFYEEICFVEQAHMVEEGNPKISKFLEEKGLELKRFESLSI